MKTSVAILAAGLGTRMRSKQAKVLHRAGGMALVEWVVEAAREFSEPQDIVCVTGHQADKVEALLASRGLRFALQTQQKGTGHALVCAQDALAGNQDGLVLVLYGDTPLLSAHTLQRLRDKQAASNAAATLITTTLDDPTGYGRVLVDSSGAVTAIVEHRDATPDQRAIHVINSGIYCFRADLLWKHLPEVQPNPLSGEYYLTDMAAILRGHGDRVEPMHVEDPSELLGINTRVELAAADGILRQRKNQALMLAGVTIERPETVTIDAHVKVGSDSVIEASARLLGSTEIGEDCHIGAGAIIENSRLADRVHIAPYTVISDSTVETGAHLGPFSRLRMQAHVCADAHVGNFVELKKTKLGAGSKSQHLAYLGDSEIGAQTNIGAGTIICNYDGERKHPTKIGRGVFIGSNSTLVAPIEIGDQAYVGAASVITENVPEDALALGRARQVVKPGWVSKRKASKKSKA
jgi:bifunctional UDP-N-acetylglucosamine pyrophosphorylase/glucosamine-1-phosphate N-acetyltransferase